MASLYGWWFQFLAFLKIYILGVIYLLKELYKRTLISKPLSIADLPSRAGCVAIVTGGSDGIGLQTVYQLLSKEMHVIIGSKLSPEECLKLKMSLEEIPKAKVDVWHVDLASMSSVKAFAERFLEKNWELNLLINNGGIMFFPHSITKDGYEEHLAVNYLSHCLLIRLLLPQMAASGTSSLQSRIIFMTSCAHFVGYINFADLHGQDHYSKYHSYVQSKLAIVLMTYQLQKYLESKAYNLTVNCLHPGVVNTRLYQHVWWAPIVAPYVFKTPSEGAETVTYASLAPELEGIGGKYLEDCSIVSSSELSYDLSLQKQMSILTWKLLEKWL